MAQLNQRRVERHGVELGGFNQAVSAQECSVS
jgi:hypothetical protein